MVHLEVSSKALSLSLRNYLILSPNSLSHCHVQSGAHWPGTAWTLPAAGERSEAERERAAACATGAGDAQLLR